jgi:hypothetical protein
MVVQEKRVMARKYIMYKGNSHKLVLVLLRLQTQTDNVV